MASICQNSSSNSLTIVYMGARPYLLSLLLFGGMIITPVVSSPTGVNPANHESILHALRFQGMTAFANALDNIIWNHAFMVFPNATLFVPMNNAMEPVATTLNDIELIKLVSYHIVKENLPVARLLELPLGTKLNTMVANSSFVVTENTKTVMTINHQEVMPKDLCTTSAVACYAVKEVLLQESEVESKSFDVSVAIPLAEAPILPPLGLPLSPLGAPVDPPLGAPVPTGAPLVLPPPESPATIPVPAMVPIVSPPAESPLGAVPVPAGAPAVIGFPFPGSPGGAPLSPGAAPAEAPLSAATATTASTATLVAALMLTILVGL